MFLYELTDSFQKAGLRYALVGGYALAVHGLARNTVDVDFVLTLNLSDFELAENLLTKLGLQSRIPVRAQDIIKMREEYIRNRNLLAWSFVDFKDPTRQVDILITTSLPKIETEIVSVGGRKITVASLKELLKMKTNAGRPQDLVDIENIKAKLNEKK